MVNTSRAVATTDPPLSLSPSLFLSHAILHYSCNSCLEGGLLPALTYRNMARLNTTATLLTLSLPVSQDGDKWLLETLQGQQRAGVYMEPQRLAAVYSSFPAVGICSAKFAQILYCE